MGIDAIMLARIPEVLSKEDVLSLAVDCHEAFGSNVWVNRPRNHCIEIDNENVWHEPTKEGETWLRVHLGGSGRYYGEGYERGYLANYIAIAKWIEERLPTAQIYYGGDSGDYIEDLFDEKRRNELWKHYCKVGHKPYTGSFSKALGDKDKIQFCDFCHIAMQQNGFSQTGYAAFYCQGCGWKTETKDYGKTYTAVAP